MYSRCLPGILLRRYQTNFICETIRNAQTNPQHRVKLYGKFKWRGSKMSMWLREHSIQVIKNCLRQFEFIAAQRIRRSVQFFHLYTRLWDEIALREFIRCLRRKVTRNTKDFFYGAVGVAAFNWEQERIPNKEMYSYRHEIEGIHTLQRLTLICPVCHLRLIVDTVLPGISYCQCQKIKYAYNHKPEEDIDWEPLIERKDMLVWRREEENAGGLYAYKVYGSFDDVTAEDFLQVQIDINYRKEWDATVKQLELLDSDPSLRKSPESGSDIIYWEMAWPRMFANRDYIYQRRWLYDKERGIIIIVSKGTDHPNAPHRPDTHRIKTYWSFMVIKPYKNYHEQGIEFSLTYFEDPGVSVPSAFSSWVAMSGLPDYLTQMRQAGRDYKNYKASQESIQIKSYVVDSNQDIKEITSDASDKEKNIVNDLTKRIEPSIETDDNNESNKNETKTKKSLKPTSKNGNKTKDKSDQQNEDGDEPDTKDEERGYFDYFLLAKLFA